MIGLEPKKNLFSTFRLPTFSEENLPLLKKLKMRNSGIASESRSGRRAKPGTGNASKTGNYENRKKGQAKKQQQQAAASVEQAPAKKEVVAMSLPIADPVTPSNSE